MTENIPRREAHAELHYIQFEDGGSFEELCRRHGLAYDDSLSDDYPLFRPVYNHVWTRSGDLQLALATARDPRTGDGRDEGYASYVGVQGQLPEVEALYRDVIETAHGIKGEFKPLTAGDGEVIAENWRGRDNL